MSIQNLADLPLEHGPVWPVFIAGAAFLYIWGLAILAFDLTFIWHLYIRYPGADKYIEQRIKKSGASNGQLVRVAAKLAER